MAKSDPGPSWNRDDEQKPGRPPRTAYEPEGSEASAQTPKTMTDPATGAPNAEPQTPNQAEHADRKVEGKPMGKPPG